MPARVFVGPLATVLAAAAVSVAVFSLTGANLAILGIVAAAAAVALRLWTHHASR